jgi:SAM-dependent methyltransferase
LVPAVFAAWAPLVVMLADPRPGERVLDVACGTGVVAQLASQRVGRTGKVAPTDAPITWEEASATKMPLPDGSFDIVYCQLGLEFFPDRLAALREMHRVLVPGGRLGLMVWRGIEHSPGFEVLASALARHVSSEAAGIMRAPFALGNVEELHGLISGASFREIVIRPASGTVSFPSVARFVQDYVAGSPLAGHVAKASDEARAALVSEVGVALKSHLSATELRFPIEAQLASAKK